MESISITRSAPAAKPLIAPLTASEALSASAKPTGVAIAHMNATPVQRRRMAPRRVPALSMSAAEPIASGRFEMKIATSSPTPTPCPRAIPIPSTSCSGMPSRKAPRASAGPGSDVPAPSPLPPKRRCTMPPATKYVTAPMPRPTAADAGPPIFAPSSASSKLTALISAPAPKARTRPTWRCGQRRANASSTPSTSEDAASAPHPIAAPMLSAS